MNRLRAHFANIIAQKEPKRTQAQIVDEYRSDIISLIADDGATLDQIAAAVRAYGEPVLDHGFKAEVLKQLGTVKAIRAGHLRHATPPALHSQPLVATTPRLNDGCASVMPPVDDDRDFEARRRRD